MVDAESIPWNNGDIFHAFIPPSDINCPTDTSRKKVGIPPSIQHTKYGIRNAPTEQ